MEACFFVLTKAATQEHDQHSSGIHGTISGAESRAPVPKGPTTREVRAASFFANERVERFDPRGAKALRGVEIQEGAKTPSGKFAIRAGTLIPPGNGFESVRAK